MKFPTYGTLVFVALVLLVCSIPVAVPIGAQGNFDVVISHGRVMDPESGLNEVRNIGIAAGKIRAISAAPLTGKTRIDAKGLVVAPGFIDLHEHAQTPESYKYQAHDGVTTSLELEVGTDDVEKWYTERQGKTLINFGVSIGPHPRAHEGYRRSRGLPSERGCCPP